MRIYEKVSKFKPVLKDMNRDICVTAKDGTRDCFYVTVSHDGVLNDLYARIYHLKDQWYIWYYSISSRVEVTNFTEALHVLEGEILRCVA